MPPGVAVGVGVGVAVGVAVAVGVGVGVGVPLGVGSYAANIRLPALCRAITPFSLFEFGPACTHEPMQPSS